MTRDELEHFDLILRSKMVRRRRLGAELSDFFDGFPLQEVLYEGAKVLGLGCGRGLTLIDLAKKYGAVPYGIDLKDFSNISLNSYYSKIYHYFRRLFNLNDDFQFCKASINGLPFQDNSFDFVYSYMTFCYLQNKIEGLIEAHRVLKIGSFAVIDFSDLSSIVCTHPRIQEIISAFPNRGQIGIEEKRIRRNQMNKTHLVNRVIIEKKYSDVLSFPRYLGTEFYDLSYVYGTCFYEL